MDEKDWHILEILMEEQSITQTAKRLFFSQPSLSGKIKQIEKEFGCEIVIREPRGITFTAQGKILARYAAHFRSEMQQIKEDINNTNKEVCGVLSIGCSNIFAKYLLPSILKKFLERYPRVDIHVKTGLSQEIYNQIFNGHIQIGIIRGNYPWSGKKLILQKDPFCIVNLHPININNLPKLPLIHRHTDKPLQTSINNWWMAHFKEPPYMHMEVDSLDSCIQMVTEGLGYAILSELSIKESPLLWSERLTFSDKTLLTRTTWAYLHEKHKGNRLVETFYDFLENYTI
jgi:DNA-binding transcriptional LysR family regulator